MTAQGKGRVLTAFGETRSIVEWARDPRCRVSYSTLMQRSAHLDEGQDATEIITTPGHMDQRLIGRPTAPQKRCVQCARLLTSGARLSRCDICRPRRAHSDRERKKAIAEAVFPPARRADLLRRLAAGEHLTDACQALDLSVHRVYGFKKYDDTWGEQLDAALTAGRVPDLAHGTEATYRHARCRCPDCRAAHAAYRC